MANASGGRRVDYICAAANSTRDLDVAETRAVKAAFGEGARDISISSVKSMIGEFDGSRIATSITPPTKPGKKRSIRCFSTASQMEDPISLSSSEGMDSSVGQDEPPEMDRPLFAGAYILGGRRDYCLISISISSSSGPEWGD